MSGPNLFERAKSIRMNGENWQNAIQRAKAQLKYEIQLGGDYSDSMSAGARKGKGRRGKTGKKGRKKGSHNKPGPICRIDTETGKCGKTKYHDGPAGFCGQRYTRKGNRTCYRRHTGTGSDRQQVTDVDGVHVDPYLPSKYITPGTAADLREARKKIGQYGGSDLYSSLYGGSSYDSSEFSSLYGGARTKGKRKGKGKRKSKRKVNPAKHRRCGIDEETNRCGRSKLHDQAYDLCKPHISQKTGHLTCHRRKHKVRGKYVPRTRSRDGTFPAARRSKAQRSSQASKKELAQIRELSPFGHSRRGRRTPSGRGSRADRHSARRQTAGDYFQQGGFLDNLSATSSTRSSDFTDVSDTTSYTMSGGSFMDDISYTENDNTSVW